MRNILKIKRVGHCGTLDPMATGVLLVVFGKCTSLSEKLMAGKKVYRGEMRLGIKTDSGDITGRVLEVSALPALNRKILEKAFRRLRGVRKQVPPMFSAVKWRGRKLYEYAREGIAVPRPARKVTIHSITLLDLNPPLVTFRMVCSKGTYVRSFVEEVGKFLKVPATLSGLVREKSGSYSLADSVAWNELTQMTRDQLLSRSGLPPNQAPVFRRLS